MAEHSHIRASVAQLLATLRELETAPGRDRELHLLTALEGQAGTLQGQLRRHRKNLTPPSVRTLKGKALRAVVSKPGRLTSGMLAKYMGSSERRIYDVVRDLRAEGWLQETSPNRYGKLRPTVVAIEALTVPERRLR